MTKLEKIRGYMRERGIDAFLVYNELNQQYVTEFAFTDGVVLITEKSAHLLTDFRYIDMAKSVANPEFKVDITKNRTEYISEVLVGEGIRSIGFEGDFVSFDAYANLTEKYKGFSFVGAGDIFLLARERKEPDEIEKIAAAQRITDAAFSHILTVLTPNMTEIEVAAELEYFMRKSGADGFAFETIAVSGVSSSLPHGTPKNIKLRSGFLTMDYGARVGGYCSDMTRTVVIGKADAEMKKLYNTVLSAQQAALDFLRAGVDCAAADKVARDIIDKDYEGAFGHSLGHSVGLFIHESPNLSSRSVGRLLRGGEVVTVEPGIYLSGKYGCRIEDMVLITENGIENFTKSPKELVEIG